MNCNNLGMTLSLCLLCVITLACQTVTDPVVPVAPSVPPDQLCPYNDTFDVFDKDRWDFGYFIGKENRSDNFKPADVLIKDGQLNIITQKGAFSKAAVGTRFYLAGDFDIQMDCEFSFFGLEANAMDQRIIFALFEEGASLSKTILPSIIFVKQGGKNSVTFAGCIQNTQLKGNISQNAGAYKGTVRFIRISKKVLLYSKEDGRYKWIKLGACSSTEKKMTFFVAVQNFTFDRQIIDAQYAFNVRFDNFKINAAEKVIESEI